MIPRMISAAFLILAIVSCDFEKGETTMSIQDGNLTRDTSLVVKSNDPDGKSIDKSLSEERLKELREQLGPTERIEQVGAATHIRKPLTGLQGNEYGGKTGFYTVKSGMGEAHLYFERVWGDDNPALELETCFRGVDHAAELLCSFLDREHPGHAEAAKIKVFIQGDLSRTLKNLITYQKMFPKESDFFAHAGVYLAEHHHLNPEKLGQIIRDFQDKESFEFFKLYELQGKDGAGLLGWLEVVTALQFPEDASLQTWLAGHPLLADTAKMQALLKEKATDLDKDFEVALFGCKLPEFWHLFGNHKKTQELTLNIPAGIEIKNILSNGTIDEVKRRITWSYKDDEQPLPVAYAYCFRVDESFQKAHFGRVVDSGDMMPEYLNFLFLMSADERRIWEEFLSSLKPGDDLVAKWTARGVKWPKKLQSEMDGVLQRWSQPPVPDQPNLKSKGE
ncbi:MAG: hypothetical protein RL095_3084 [Verrucomicrobiota bacterium]|jgi:hypothetical protein